ncbi:rhodanese-like domain-containing protein [Streptococcus acidominimus]|uniref:NADH dehydrogenase n=1 Tax=Streptococcus acidominimus TaxID=1326 RepID=A0A1Q8ECZ7_STRAI|nr:rhodanese-like domain-containing protein [Streptococcus acidominimus]MBF0847922.1 rhodanese-like domain-containing protein [Streptococcus danieliae]MBF0819238.1 rhodanese-like domain-containing protein [Streptococcus acidominimus]MBF0839474.1 rhodanese-like domain-containing protein [Streptococcus acidominimus]OLF49652.1 NADH dehydrogenase [Streptococcus acidominimus]TFU30164.1 rhodanese-like domain-containing protein [Streptococcus acidominimus]
MSTLYVLLLVVIVLGVWVGFNYWRLRRAAKVVENHAFAEKIHGGQVVDLREPAEYRKKHIMGARNIPAQQLKQSLAALRKDRPVLLYENDRGQLVMQAALLLKKNGYKDIYILSYGLNGWDGKVKMN